MASMSGTEPPSLEDQLLQDLVVTNPPPKKGWFGVRESLVARQQEDGSWTDPICVEYGTAMACIILQMPNNYLPIFQR